jgi:hypothetical protein
VRCALLSSSPRGLTSFPSFSRQRRRLRSLVLRRSTAAALPRRLVTEDDDQELHRLMAKPFSRPRLDASHKRLLARRNGSHHRQHALALVPWWIRSRYPRQCASLSHLPLLSSLSNPLPIDRPVSCPSTSSPASSPPPPPPSSPATSKTTHGTPHTVPRERPSPSLPSSPAPSRGRSSSSSLFCPCRRGCALEDCSRGICTAG